MKDREDTQLNANEPGVLPGLESISKIVKHKLSMYGYVFFGCWRGWACLNCFRSPAHNQAILKVPGWKNREINYTLNKDRDGQTRSGFSLIFVLDLEDLPNITSSFNAHSLCKLLVI